jgi:uracil-DNA glycosylase family 4
LTRGSVRCLVSCRPTLTVSPPLRNRLKRIRDANCTACPLHTKAQNVCVPGDGTARYPVLVLGEAPGSQEDQRAGPFVGRAGHLLRAELAKAGLPPALLWLTNACKCFPQGTPTQSELETCSSLYLRREVALLRPTWILALGRSALVSCCETTESITKVRGQIYPSKNFQGHSCLVFPTFHPAYVLRKRGGFVEKQFKRDIEAFSAFVRVDLGVHPDQLNSEDE